MKNGLGSSLEGCLDVKADDDETKEELHTECHGAKKGLHENPQENQGRKDQELGESPVLLELFPRQPQLFFLPG